MNAKILQEHGYREDRWKQNLFVKETKIGNIYADMRGTKEVPISECSEPLVWGLFGDLPIWKQGRIIKEEKQQLEKSGCTCRESFYSDPTDGFCIMCNKDFHAEGEFCSVKCEKECYGDEDCYACYKEIDFGEDVSHHVTYFPENVVRVHRSCHNLIHKTDKYPHLRPPKEEIIRFYHKPKKILKKKFRVKKMKEHQALIPTFT